MVGSKALNRLPSRLSGGSFSNRIAYGGLLAVVLGTLLWARDFSHVHIPIGQFPVYITEAFLLVWILLRVPVADHFVRGVPRLIFVALTIWVGIGALALLRTVVENGWSENVLRDFALFYYALFLLAAADLLRFPGRPQRIVQIVVLSAFFIAGNGLLLLVQGRELEITTSGTDRTLSIAQGLYLLLSLSAAITALSLRWRPRALYVMAIPVSLIGLAFSQSRSIILALPLVVGVYALSRWPRVWHYLPLIFCICVVLGSIVILGASDVTGFAGGYFTRRLQSLFALSTDPNATSRLQSWVLAIQTAAENPLEGAGFGQLSALPLGAPHNSIVSVLFETGIPGVAAFLILNVAFYAFVGRSIRSATSDTDRALLATALAWQVAILIVAFFNVALEGPFMGMLFWLSMGFAIAVASLGSSGYQVRGGMAARDALVANPMWD